MDSLDESYLRFKKRIGGRAVFERRARILASMRAFFVQESFLEVETPILVRLPGMEPYLDTFRTRFEPERGEGRDMYLITSPEYAMKELLVGGFEKIFQITRSFRNKETGGALHNPEFTILEWYRTHADYTDIMRDTEAMIRRVGREATGCEEMTRDGSRIDLSAPFERLRVREAFERYAGVGTEIFEDAEALIAEAIRRGYAVKPELERAYDDAFFLIFLNEIESRLGRERPTILYEYPVSMAALARACPHDSRYAERFELYIGGIEIANAFSELTDPVEQRRRLEEERALRALLGKLVYDIDERFLRALELGMPPSGGIALGVDRLVMLLLGKNDIADVMLFPFRDL